MHSDGSSTANVKLRHSDMNLKYTPTGTFFFLRISSHVLCNSYLDRKSYVFALFQQLLPLMHAHATIPEYRR